MVFLIQNTQNREGAALQAKLDEIIRVLAAAENRFIGLEQRDEEQITASAPATPIDERQRRHATDGKRRRNPRGSQLNDATGTYAQ